MLTRLVNIHKLLQIREGSEAYSPVKGAAMAHLPCIDNAWLCLKDGKIDSYGSMDALPELNPDTTIDTSGRLVLPAWNDSHTHLVFAGTRENEFVDRIKGLSYQEIAARGGGILNSAQKLKNTSEDALYASAAQRLESLIATGTGAIEIKSGYGLDVDNELKMLRVIKRLQENYSLPVCATLLAAHAYPMEYKENKPAYIRYLINELIPEAAHQKLATYIDVFCEDGFFSVADTQMLLEAGIKYGLKPKIHANQLGYSGGVQVGVQYNAISVDHLEHVGQAEIDALLPSNTVPTVLPAAAFFLALPYQPARKMIDAGMPVCIASDYNPGSCPTGNIPFLHTIACTQLKMTPEEAINATTLNGAAAMELLQETGSITVGKRANLIITKPMPSVALIPYQFGQNIVEKVLINGKAVW
ncbi:MAG: imidazolonepropionase [Chitinophagia bacterium]|nr:imidazolonepropionase [Chitinophagia bacterium]